VVGWSCLDGAGSVLRAVVVVFGPENGEADARRETCEAVSASGGDELGGDGGVGWGAVGAGAGEGGCCECVIVEAGGGVFVLRGRRCRVDGGVCHFGYGALLMLVTGWPPPEQTPTMAFFVGPLTISAAALLFLGEAVENNVDVARAGDKGSLPTPEAAQAIRVTCILFGLVLVGMDVISLFVAFMAVVFWLSREELQWNPTWNGVVFPVATLAITTAQFSDLFHSRFLGGFTCILATLSSVLLVVHFLFTIVYVSRGKLLVVREDRRLSARFGQSLKSH